ncbi:MULTISPECIES: YkgJ family cysteine cluster protein [unclassified Dyella]|uniref:YkgJ family cysteine cluster protein n=1 Tax=unclassified Dyella TaxID=2634549 RepID=UPI000C86392A|nr:MULTISPECIES: YkgJ family cysteine cluster protein [unclassified Dyella]MDR3447694.1 YkgJ family cysteine cluster protein [Dyella sp.]
MNNPQRPSLPQQHVGPDSEPGDPSAHAPANKLRLGRAHCSTCQAGCCRLTVVLQPDDHVPDHITTYSPEGLHVMKRSEDGWCVALDREHMNCGIYETRPSVCRRFVMNGPYCRTIYADWSNSVAVSARPKPVA